MVSTTFGTHAKPVVSTRYGGTINEDAGYRLYAKGFRRDNFEDGTGADSHDAWESYRTGFRLDSTFREEDSLSLQAEVFDGEADFTSMATGRLSCAAFCQDCRENRGVFRGPYSGQLSAEPVIRLIARGGLLLRRLSP